MTETVQLGWRIPAPSWEFFTEKVVEKHANQNVYIRISIETAIMEMLDDDELLAETESILRECTDLQELSSSTAVLATDRYQNCDTRLCTHRIRADLKERFKTFADKHDASYGRLLAVALDVWAEGGRARRILEDVKRAFSAATNTGSTDDSIENSAATGNDSGSTDEAVENQFSTVAQDATTTGSTDSTPDPVKVSDAVNAVCDIESVDDTAELRMFPRSTLEDAIERAVGRADDETMELYHDSVLDQLAASEHPYINDIYITDWAREEETFWTDLEKEERLVLLRRYAVADAIYNDERKRAFSYTDVQDLFEEKTGDGPSDQYAYDLMEGAADGEEGIHYGEFSVGTSSSKIQLRVNVSEVSDAILNWVREETRFDPSSIGVTADVTSYASGAPPQPEGAADD